MDRRRFLKSATATGLAVGLSKATARAYIPEHNWDKYDFGPSIGLAYQLADKTVIRAGFGIFYGGEENQGGSPNRGEGVPFNETVNLVRTNGVSSFVGVSMPQCTGCNYFPNGLTGGYPTNIFTLPDSSVRA